MGAESAPTFTIWGRKAPPYQELNNGLLEEGKTSEPTSDDEAYFIYAYQENTGIPVFHELMSVAKQMADDSPDNAPVQADRKSTRLNSSHVR